MILLVIFRFVQEKGKRLFWLIVVMFMDLVGWDMVALVFLIGVYLVE